MAAVVQHDKQYTPKFITSYPRKLQESHTITTVEGKHKCQKIHLNITYNPSKANIGILTAVCHFMECGSPSPTNTELAHPYLQHHNHVVLVTSEFFLQPSRVTGSNIYGNVAVTIHVAFSALNKVYMPENKNVNANS